jgi:type IV secretion system protein TrbL
MQSTGIIDHFLSVFTQYIDSGFGLLGGEVRYLASTLIVIDVVLAGLFWAWGAEQDITARLIKKTLFTGFFAWLIGNWNSLARIVFESFAGLGLKASGSSLTKAEFLQPGRVAQVGIDAGKPILEAAGQLMGFVSFFENFVQIAVLMLAWLTVLIAFFILAVQLFVTLIEFKLTTLAGFVLIPFGLFGQTAFLAERVLGNVVASGVKALVLAVIVGIGSTLFADFTQGFGADQPSLEDAMAIVLAALAMLGLGIFGPGIANGLISGGPQLGAGAAVGAGLAAGGTLAAGAAGMRLAGGAAMNAARGGGSAVGGAVTAYRAGAAASPGGGASAVAGGVANVARTGVGAAAEKVRAAFVSSASRSAGGDASLSSGAPDWARRMRREQALSHGVSTAANALRSSDSASGGSSVSLEQDDR